jgi:5-methylcytosine-specific restriction endonuclease McrA
MTKTNRLLAHPLSGVPYEKLVFAGFDHNRVALYNVEGTDEPATKPYEALKRAFQHWGGKCFYCHTKFAAQAFTDKTVGRDHVRPKSKDGPDLLYNLVIACRTCDRVKANDAIHDFRPKAAQAYLAALENHIAGLIEESGGRRS